MASKKPSGRDVHESERHTAKLQIRMPPELAERARALAAELEITLADVVLAGVEALARGKR